MLQWIGRKSLDDNWLPPVFQVPEIPSFSNGFGLAANITNAFMVGGAMGDRSRINGTLPPAAPFSSAVVADPVRLNI